MKNTLVLLFSSRRRHTRCALVTGVQTCALPIWGGDVEMQEYGPSGEPAGSARPAFLGILRDLETGRMVPGQRLVETELASRHGVGRNAAREAMQQLDARGVVDPTPHRSPAIRKTNLYTSEEPLEGNECVHQS